MRQQRGQARAAVREDLVDQLRRAAVDSRLSAGELGRRAGVDRKVVSRFVSGERADLALSSAAAIAEALGLVLSRAPGRKAATGPRPATPPAVHDDVPGEASRGAVG
jgi:transcriptional regulator with XRE-family HTH domain